MELVVIGLLGYGAWLSGRRLLAIHRERRALAHVRRLTQERVRAQVARQQTEALRHDDELRRQNHAMQTALLELDQAPDFFRAASFAAQARAIPVDFRRRQFHRFRGHILEHLARRLRGGGDAEALRASLAQLTTNLGLPEFEANYLWQEVQGQLRAQQPRANANFATQINSLQQAHDQRMTVLRTIPGIDNELREQLIEAEEERFRQALLSQNEPREESGAEF